MTRRKKYSREFKLDAISPVWEWGHTQAAAVRNLDVNANMPRRWMTGYGAHDWGISQQWQPEVAW